jgi:LysR family transcriptional regulator (chromosome initiation inhibitor)
MAPACQRYRLKTNYHCFIWLRNTNFTLDYASLAALAAVVREGSFERAARALHVTPSAVSQRIRLLEERMGGALVVRGQPCLATETGRRLCQHVDRVRLLEHELHGEVPALAPVGQTRVPLPIAVNADSLATWFASAVTAFAATAPVLMNIAVDDQDHTAEWLRSGQVLAAVTGTARPATGCNSRLLGALRYVAAASPAYVARYFPKSVGAASLAQAPSLVFNSKDELQSRWVRRL